MAKEQWGHTACIRICIQAAQQLGGGLSRPSRGVARSSLSAAVSLRMAHVFVCPSLLAPAVCCFFRPSFRVFPSGPCGPVWWGMSGLTPSDPHGWGRLSYR
eukprot:364557-Chlamydomonas_euryale.AAC.7